MRTGSRLFREAITNAAGAADYVRVQVLTPVGVLHRDKQLGVVKELTEIVAAELAAPSCAHRTWVLITELPEGGWGIDRRREHERGHRRRRPSRARRGLTAREYARLIISSLRYLDIVAKMDGSRYFAEWKLLDWSETRPSTPGV